MTLTIEQSYADRIQQRINEAEGAEAWHQYALAMNTEEMARTIVKRQGEIYSPIRFRPPTSPRPYDPDGFVRSAELDPLSVQVHFGPIETSVSVLTD